MATFWQIPIYAPSCGSTVLGTPESVGMNGQIDWQAQQISHLVCSLAGQRCSGAWGTFSTRTSQSITALTAWRKEEWRKEAADIPPSKVDNDLCSTRQILVLFRGQPWGGCWETGRSAYGPFRALWCHLELKLKLKLHPVSQWFPQSCPRNSMNVCLNDTDHSQPQRVECQGLPFSILFPSSEQCCFVLTCPCSESHSSLGIAMHDDWKVDIFPLPVYTQTENQIHTLNVPDHMWVFDKVLNQEYNQNVKSLKTNHRGWKCQPKVWFVCWLVA